MGKFGGMRHRGNAEAGVSEIRQPGPVSAIAPPSQSAPGVATNQQSPTYVVQPPRDYNSHEALLQSTAFSQRTGARSFLSWLPQLRTLTVFTRVSADPPGSFHAPWSYQQVRPKARGNEYQPSNIKRKRKHGWIRRLSTPGGIQVILRRMLKGRKSLSH
uniref:Large ribosomal subunit protein bL34m n=1 Tax=Monodelphis domestica TaxID=13616 RepID=A0A5F8GSI7_MONDO